MDRLGLAMSFYTVLAVAAAVDVLDIHVAPSNPAVVNHLGILIVAAAANYLGTLLAGEDAHQGSAVRRTVQTKNILPPGWVVATRYFRRHSPTSTSLNPKYL